jgi:hypothetical protein
MSWGVTVEDRGTDHCLLVDDDRLPGERDLVWTPTKPFAGGRGLHRDFADLIVPDAASPPELRATFESAVELSRAPYVTSPLLKWAHEHAETVAPAMLRFARIHGPLTAYAATPARPSTLRPDDGFEDVLARQTRDVLEVPIQFARAAGIDPEWSTPAFRGSAPSAETRTLWLAHAAAMYLTLRATSAELKADELAEVYRAVERRLNGRVVVHLHPPGGHLAPGVRPNPLGFYPTDLLGGLWLLTARELVGLGESKQCLRCRTWFRTDLPASSGRKARSDRKYCSVECQTTHWYAAGGKEKKAAAYREKKAQGKLQTRPKTRKKRKPKS